MTRQGGPAVGTVHCIEFAVLLPLRGRARLSAPLQWRVRSAILPGNLQLPMALATRKGHAASVRRQSRQRLRSERRYIFLSRSRRRYRRNRSVRFYRHLERTGSAFPRLPRRFAPRNDNSGAFAISTMVRSFRRCSAGHGCPLPRNYNTWSAASRSFPLSIFSLPHVPFLKNQFQTRCVLGGAQRVFSGKMTVLRHFSV